jgi:HK97 gp10 family phage protein
MTVEGLSRLRTKLTKTIPAAAKTRIREALEASADEAVMQMKRLAPVDDGDLQMSISWTWGDAPKGAMTIATSSKSVDGMRITIFAGNAKAYYARFVEFGTSPHVNAGKFAGSRNPGTKAQPFFYPGWRLARRKAKGRVSRAIRKAAKEAAAT